MYDPAMTDEQATKLDAWQEAGREGDAAARYLAGLIASLPPHRDATIRHAVEEYRAARAVESATRSAYYGSFACDPECPCRREDGRLV